MTLLCKNGHITKRLVATTNQMRQSTLLNTVLSQIITTLYIGFSPLGLKWETQEKVKHTHQSKTLGNGENGIEFITA
jgi:hypothetical protein